MDTQTQMLLDAVNAHFRAYFESAQQRFPNALEMLSRDENIASLREISNIKPDLLSAIRNVKSADVSELFASCDIEALDYKYKRLYDRHLLYKDVPEKLLVQRENLRRTGYVIMGHAQDARRYERHGFQGYVARALLGDMALHRSASYIAHIENVFENARKMSKIQARTLGLKTPYEANLADFTPGIRQDQYETLLNTLLKDAVTARTHVLKIQKKEAIPLPSFSLAQGQHLVDLICDLLPIKNDEYRTYLLEGIPSMCMGNIATIKFSENPLVLAETIFHERIGHLAYRYHADQVGGISGFHMDEARALSLERFFLREEGVFKQILPLFEKAYGQVHASFTVDNLLKLTHIVQSILSERTSSDDLTYIIQEVIRGKAEMLVINDNLRVKDMPEYLAEQTEQALGLSGLNGYHIMRETFQWPLCMQGHLASYPQGMVMAAQLHAAAKKTLNKDMIDLSEGENAAYFKFMKQNVDAYGSIVSAKDIVEKATGQDYLDMTSIKEYLQQKKDGNISSRPS